jgi:hypothetical protein
MAVTTFTLPYVGTPPYFSGTASSSLVPHTFPVAIDGRPYMIDQKSGQFKRGYEQRVRDSSDDSTTPGEGAINPGGLWRRGQDSWHFGAGQQYADTAESKDYMFYKSKGINPWVKGQLSLLNATKLSLSSSATSQHMVVQDGRVYVSLNGDVKYTANPFASSPTWTDCTGEPGGSCQAMATDGNDVYLAFPNDGVRRIDTSAAIGTISGTKFVNSNDNYYVLGFAKNFMWGAHDHKLRTISSGGSATDHITPADTSFTWVGVATGQNAVYAAGYSGKKSLIYKITIKTDGTLDQGVVALELPTGEVVTAISGYLGFILIGTNQGVRFCSTDSNSNLNAGQLIPTVGPVYKFSSYDRFVWFTYSHYDSTSGGLGRLDLSVFTAANTPAHATDLMYASTNDVTNVVVFPDAVSGVYKHVFMVSGVGVIAEDSTQLVATGEVETGTWRWGIPDRKFVAKIDTRSTPLAGSITSYLKLDDGEYQEVGVWDTGNDIENSFDGSDTRAIEAAFKYVLARSSTATSTGPTFTRWMARAYAAPFRSQVFVVPVLLHHSVTVRGKEYYYDVEEEQLFFDGLIGSPRIIALQMGSVTHSVILEDLQWDASDSQGNTWQFNGTLVVTLRSVEN